MSLQLDLGIVDGLREIARQASNVINKVPRHGNVENMFGWNPLNSNMPTYVFSDEHGLVCRCGNDHSEIIFKNIVPSKILDMEIGQPVTFNEQETGVELDKWRNAGSTPMCVNYTESKKKTVTESLNIAAEIATEIRSKVSGGNPATIQAEVEAKISMKLGIKYGKETKTEQADGQKIDLAIPPWTYTTLTQKHGVSDVRQRITTHCELEAEVLINSRGHWCRSFPSIRSLQLYLNGGGGGTDPGGQMWVADQYFVRRNHSDFEFDTSSLNLTITNDRIYRNVATGDIIRVDSPIAVPEEYADAEAA